jgi:mono/diheme cytochrome c family protein
MTRSVLALVLTLALAGAAPASGQEATSSVAEGRGVALKICARCHVVAKDQAEAPVLKPPAPSFSAIAARNDVTEASLRAFLAEPHGKKRRNGRMAPFLVPGAQTDAVIAYLMSLKPKP